MTDETRHDTDAWAWTAIHLAAKHRGPSAAAIALNVCRAAVAVEDPYVMLTSDDDGEYYEVSDIEIEAQYLVSEPRDGGGTPCLYYQDAYGTYQWGLIEEDEDA